MNNCIGYSSEVSTAVKNLVNKSVIKLTGTVDCSLRNATNQQSFFQKRIPKGRPAGACKSRQRTGETTAQTYACNEQNKTKPPVAT